MLIDGWDISEANARQARFTNSHHSITNNSSWNTGSNRPIFEKNQLDFKSFTLELWVKGNGYQDIVNNRGLILYHLQDVVSLVIDGYSHRFKAILDKYSVDEKSKRRFHILKLNFVGYEYSDEEIYEIEAYTSFNIRNVGTLETPVILELIPKDGSIGVPVDQMEVAILEDSDGKLLADEDGAAIGNYEYNSIVITGLCRDPRTGEELAIEVRNVTAGKRIVIDGETGLIMEDGVVKIDDVDIWALPTILPGDNLVVTNNNWLGVVVRYEPRYM
jgi:hypothetical protein